MKLTTPPLALLLVAAGSLLGIRALDAQVPPGHNIDQKELCLGCHDLEDTAGGVVHAPVDSGECTACHNPHVARYGALLRERPGPLCFSCHEELRGALELPVVHAPVAESRCADCHQPHGSPHQDLLVAASDQLCGECHEEVAAWRKRPVQHSPFVRNRCGRCHDSHAAEHPGLMVRAGGDACVSCHPQSAAFRRSHSGYPVERAACHQCHDPHASVSEGLFRESVHAPLEGGDCETCHLASGATEPFALTSSESELCGDCHEEVVELSREAPFAHVSAGGGNCTDCHNPHTGDGSGLLRADLTSLCTDCHDPGGAASGSDDAHLTHAELECTVCHGPHGDDRPLLLTESSVELCGSCHSHQHGVTHPLGEEVRDPRSGDPMTCLSCHGIHRSEGEHYLFGSDLRELCLGCHKDIGG
jgi:predicted CXXCH cytochrome family protein